VNLLDRTEAVFTLAYQLLKVAILVAICGFMAYCGFVAFVG
jgi:hypothetical protein